MHSRFGPTSWAAAACSFLASVAVAGACASARASDREHAIPPGQEDLLAEMLGRGAALPGGCRFSGGQVQAAIVVAEYDCGGQAVVVELRHRGDAPAEVPRTERFAIVVRSGAAHPDLITALESRIRSREAGLEWRQVSALRRRVAGQPMGPGALAGCAAGIMAMGLAVQCVAARRWAPGGGRRGPAIGARWRGLSLLAVLVLIGAFLASRLYFLTVLPVFIDESVHIEWARRPDGNFVAEFSVGRWLPIRLMALLVALPVDPLAGARAASVLMSLAALLGCIHVNRTLFSPAEGLLAAAVYAVLPYVLWYDRLALVDIYLVAFGTWALCFSLLALRGGGLGATLAMNLCLYASILSKPTGGLFLLVPILVGAVLAGGQERREYLKRVWPALTGALGLLLFLLWAGYGTGLLASQLAFEGGRHLAAVFVANALLLYEWLTAMLTPPVALAVAVATVVALLGLPAGARAEGFLALLLLAVLFPYALVSRTWYPNYVLFAAVPISLLLGRAIAVVCGAASRLAKGSGPSLAEPVRMVAGIALAALLACTALPFDAALLARPQEAALPAIERTRFVTGGLSGYGLPELAAFLRRQAGPHTLHVVRFDMAQPPREGLNAYLEASDALRLHVIDPGDEGAALRLQELAGTGRTLFVSNPEVEAAMGVARSHHLREAVRIWSYQRPGGESRLEVWELQLASGPT